MKPEIAILWTAALRSDQYKQAVEFLNDGQGFCCLGVLCDLHRKAAPENRWVEGSYFDEDTELPEEVRQWAGMNGRGALPEAVYLNDQSSGNHLALLNDKGMMFKQIADVIEKYKDAL